MDPLDAHPDVVSPPPAYSEQEFDSKVSQATELSLQQAKWETSKREVDADGWPRYDPAMFEEEPASLKRKDHIGTTSSPPGPAASSSSSKRPLPNPNTMKSSSDGGSFTRLDIAPLNITKKSESKTQDTQDLAGSSSRSTNPFQSIPDTEEDVEDEEIGNNVERQDPSYPQRETEEAPSVYPAPVPDQSPPSNRPLSRGAPEPAPTLKPLDLPAPVDHSNNLHRPDPDPNVRPTHHLLHHQSFPPPASTRTIAPERPRIHSIVPTISQPLYVPRVSFNPNVAYGGSATTAPSSINRSTPQKPHFPMQYNPHTLYNSAVSSQLSSRTTADASSHLSSYQSQFWSNQPPLSPARPRMRPTDRPTSTYSTMTDGSLAYGGIAPDVDRYSHYSNNNFHSMPNDRYLNR